MSAPAPKIKVQSSDGELFEVDQGAIRLSNTINTMLQDLGMDPEEQSEPIPLQNVNAATLKKVIEWCEYHKDEAPPAEEDQNNDIPAWDMEFLKLDELTFLIDLVLAANYLNIKGLMDVACKTLANMIKGKTPEEVRHTFNIKNDFTKEEEEQILKDNVWCEG